MVGGHLLESNEFEYIGSKTNISIPPLPKQMFRPTLLLTSENKLMCIDGSGTKECYVLKNGIWLIHSSLQEKRFGSATVQMPNGIYVLGGIFNNQTSEFLPLNSNQWIEGPKSEIFKKNYEFRPYGNALKLNNEEFVFTSENMIFKYNVKTNSSNHFELQERIFVGRASVLFHGKLMLTGGKIWTSNKFEYSAETILVDLKNGQSKHVGKLNIPRAMHQMNIILMGKRRKIVVFGGHDNEGHLDSIEIFNENNQIWEISNLKLNQERSNFCCIGIPSKLIFN